VSQVSETVHVLRFQCDPTLEERLKQVARDEDRSMSAVIREACRAYVRGER
jgi:predicted transcriptional regulator